MRVVVTGMPGTGKTTATERVTADLDLNVVHLDRPVKGEGLWTGRDNERDTLVVSLDIARDEFGDQDGIVESHLTRRFEAGRVIVLRHRPDVLEQCLLDRGEAEAKVRGNREPEVLDVTFSEIVEFRDRESVYETDTTDCDPNAVTGDIAAVVVDEREPSAGTVDFIDYL